MDDTVKRLVKRIKELKESRASKGDYRDSFPIAYNQLREIDKNDNDKVVHMIVPSFDGNQHMIIRYMRGSSAEIVDRISDLYPILSIDSDNPENRNIGEYGIYKIEPVPNHERKFSTNDIVDILDYVFKYVIVEEKPRGDKLVKVHNIADVLNGLLLKFNLPLNKLLIKYDRRRVFKGGNEELEI